MRVELEFPSGTVKADVTKNRLLAVHRSFQNKKSPGFVVTHLPTMKCVLWSKRKRECVAAQKELELMDWSDWPAIESRVRQLQREHS